MKSLLVPRAGFGTQGECFRPLAFLISGHFVMAAIYLVSSIHGLSAILASAPIELSCWTTRPGVAACQDSRFSGILSKKKKA